MIPLLSIVIPVYNGEQTIGACLESVCANKGLNYEVLVIDDGSTDKTLSLLRRFPVQIISLPENKGRGFARNCGIKACQAASILFTDADCLVDATWAKTAYEEFTRLRLKDSSIVASEGRVLPLKGFLNKCDAYAAYAYNQDLIPRYTDHFCTANIIVDKQKLIEVGLFNEKIPNLEDRDLGYRLLDQGYKLFYQPKFAVVHNHTRRGLSGFLKHEYEWGRTVGNYFDMRYPHRHPTPLRKWMGKLSVYTLAAPLFAVLIPLKIIVRNVMHDWTVVFLYPMLFMSKACYRIGALGFVKHNRWVEFI